MTSELKQVLMQRDKLSSKDADEQIQEARIEIRKARDPEQFLMETFGLELDYIFDLVD